MINNLEEKLSGLEPVNREELFELVNSWGRKDSFDTIDNIRVNECDSYVCCYPLENLDVSQIKNLSSVFDSSLYNGDLSKWDISNCIDIHLMFFNSNFNNNSICNWDVSNIENLELTFKESMFNQDLSNWDVSNVTNMGGLFSNSKFNNDSLKDWDVSNVVNMEKMFSNSIFNGDISKWNVSNIENIIMMFESALFDKDISSWKFNKNIYSSHMFYSNENFANKYNSGNQIPNNSKDFIKWFEENRLKIKETNISKNQILDFFDFENNKSIEL